MDIPSSRHDMLPKSLEYLLVVYVLLRKVSKFRYMQCVSLSVVLVELRDLMNAFGTFCKYSFKLSRY